MAMPEEGQAPISATGQAPLETSPASDATLEAPVEAEGQAQVSEGTAEGQSAQAQAEPGSAAGGEGAEEPTFFDPRTVPEELMPAYKQMQGAFTKRTKELAGQRQKVEAYDAFMNDPTANLQRMASQYGMHLVPVGQTPNAPVAQGTQATEAGIPADWQPNSWGEVFQKAAEYVRPQIEREMMQRMNPVFQNVQRVTASQIEHQLDQIDSQWRVYEDDMMSTLRDHPTLVNDVSKLYRLSVPEDVHRSRAVQDALKQVEKRGLASKTHGKSTVQSKPAPRKIESFHDAVQAAKQQLTEQGIA